MMDGNQGCLAEEQKSWDSDGPLSFLRLDEPPTLSQLQKQWNEQHVEERNGVGHHLRSWSPAEAIEPWIIQSASPSRWCGQASHCSPGLSWIFLSQGLFWSNNSSS